MIILKLCTNCKLIDDEVSFFREAKGKEQVGLRVILSLDDRHRATIMTIGEKETHHHSHICRDKERRAVILLELVLLFISVFLSLGQPTPLKNKSDDQRSITRLTAVQLPFRLCFVRDAETKPSTDPSLCAKRNERIWIEIVGEFIRIEIQERQRLNRYGRCTRHPRTSRVCR